MTTMLNEATALEAVKNGVAKKPGKQRCSGSGPSTNRWMYFLLTETLNAADWVFFIPG